LCLEFNHGSCGANCAEGSLAGESNHLISVSDAACCTCAVMSAHDFQALLHA